MIIINYHISQVMSKTPKTPNFACVRYEPHIELRGVTVTNEKQDCTHTNIGLRQKNHGWEGLRGKGREFRRCNIEHAT